MKELICKRCHYTWIARKESPLQCPACKNRLWNEDREQDKKVVDNQKQKR